MKGLEGGYLAHYAMRLTGSSRVPMNPVREC